MDCGAACIKMITEYNGQFIDLSDIKEICNPTREGVSLSAIAKTLDFYGYNTVGGKLTIVRLIEKQPLPAIIHWNQEHFVVLHKIKKIKGEHIFYVADPDIGLLRYKEKDFKENWCSTVSGQQDKGVILVVEKKAVFYQFTEKNKKPPKGFGILKPYFLKYKKYFYQLLLGLFIGSIIQVVFPFLTKSIVDIGIHDKNLGFINIILIAQLALLLSKMVSEFIQNWLLLHISTRINISMLSDFLVKLMKLPMGFFDTKLTGDILQRFIDFKRFEQFITQQFLTIIYAGLNLIVFGGILWFFNFPIFSVFVIGSILYILWLFLFMKRRKVLDYQLFEQRSINDNKTYQLIHGMQEIKLQGCSQRLRWEWEDVQTKLFDLNIISLKIRQQQVAGSTFINESKNVVITFLAAYAVIVGDLSLGMMLAIQYIIGQLNLPIEQIAQFVYNRQDTMISMERISDIYNKKDENHERRVKVDNKAVQDITLEDVSFNYTGSIHPTLKNINLHIKKGSTTAIVGASGSGKTTLIKLLLQYYTISRGVISIGSDNLDTIDTDSWRALCGSVMQDGFIFSDTIARNISISDDEIDKERLQYAIEVANLQEFINSLPLKLNTMIGLEGRGLSQGQKQRILIARAVYKMPQYIFLDEATNALDAENEKHITESLQSFIKDRTVFIVAHRLNTVANADNIVVLNNGEICEQGTHNELIERKGYYYLLIKNQLELGN
jgi:ATP-binding cassette subfamily B protein